MKNTQKGFSLIELMVVVAIIGILATVAVPQVTKFMAKAKQSEAKSSLAAIYTAEKGFFTEYSTHTGYFRTIGYSPEGQVGYNIGFGGVGPALPAGLAIPGGANIQAIGYCAASPGAAFTNGCKMKPEAETAGNVAGIAAPTAALFTAQARSRLTGAVDDIWTIDQNKLVSQTSNGIP